MLIKMSPFLFAYFDIIIWQSGYEFAWNGLKSGEKYIQMIHTDVTRDT